MLSVTGLRSEKHDRTLFEAMAFTLMPGSLCHVRGANGMGKTTLLRILANLETPSDGGIHWNHAPLNGNDDYRDSVLYIGHRNALLPELSVLENIAFWARCYDTETLVDAALHYFQLKPFAALPASELSAGWQRRVALARLVAVPGKFWLLDEPFTHLDKAGIELVYTLIASRCNQQGIVVMASHTDSQIQPTQVIELSDFPGAMPESENACSI